MENADPIPPAFYPSIAVCVTYVVAVVAVLAVLRTLAVPDVVAALGSVAGAVILGKPFLAVLSRVYPDRPGVE